MTRDPHSDALALARLLIEFTYDVIEKSRRLAIRESVLLARSAQTDSDIRTRLMDYLQEGLGAEQIGRLLEQQDDPTCRVAGVDRSCEELRLMQVSCEGCPFAHWSQLRTTPGSCLFEQRQRLCADDHDDRVTADGIESCRQGVCQEGYSRA